MREILEKSQFFAGLDKASIDEIATAVTLRKVVTGELIFNEGDPAGAFFVVGSGKIKVFKLSSDGKEQILLLATPGDTFAEAALFSEGRYPASASAIEDSDLLVVNRGRFSGILKRNPELSLNLIARLSQLLRHLTKLVEELSLTNVTTRLAHYLSGRLAESSDDHKSRVITLPEKKVVLAAQLGTIPETFSRSLAKLVKDGAIAVDGPRITILDPQKLDELAGFSSS